MKSITVASIAVLGFVSNAAANIAVLTPWNGVTWTSGGIAQVTWSADVNDASAQCHIQLMNGDISNGQIVAYITNPEAPVPCSDRRYDIAPLNDFTPGDYWVRIGSDDGKWSYSSKFKFEGKGSVDTRQVNAPVNILLGESKGTFNPSASAAISASSAAAGSPAATPSGPATGIKSGAPSIAPSGSASRAPVASASASANLSLSGSSSPSSSAGAKSAASSSSSSSGKGTSNNKKKNAKTENSATTQSSQGWMMAGVAALLAAMAF